MWRAATGMRIAVSLLLVSAGAEGAAIPVASRGDAYVAHDAARSEWTIGNEGIAAIFGLSADHQLALIALNGRTERRFTLPPGADTTVTLNGEPFALRDRPGGLRFSGVAADVAEGGVHLAFTYTHDTLHARIVRHYACYPNSPTLETWTQVEVIGGAAPVVVSDLIGWQLTIPAGTVHWLNGLRRDAPDTPSDEAFNLSRRDLASGEEFTLNAHWRSSEQFVPFVEIEGAGETWYGGIQWSGAWQITLARDGPQLKVTAGYPEIKTSVSADAPLEIPHSFFGIAAGDLTSVSANLRPFIDGAIRQGRPWTPLVTYNTWYAYGTRVDEATVRSEINRTAALGIELFVLDAGWYPGAGTNGAFDFESGLGTWMADPDRFPSGLRPLAEFAHESGMKFGLWVEPERVSLETVGQPGLADAAWLATRDGFNVTESAGQICFGSRAARRWVYQRLTELIDEVHPDYLKWDNNSWLNCNRIDHDHGADDGNLAQVRGLYTVLQALRERYPDLQIENVAQGGGRIDFGWLRYSDAAWMSDRTAPSTHVRHTFEGLSTVFPPAYLLSFMIDDVGEPFSDGLDFLGLARSRMPGMLGFSYRSPGLRPSIAAPIAQSIAEYLSMRDILSNADAMLLSEQVESPLWTGWDVVEELDARTGNAVVFAFQDPADDHRLVLHPRGLRAEATYVVRSLDAGVIGSDTGAALMAYGIELVPGGSSAHVLVLRCQTP